MADIKKPILVLSTFPEGVSAKDTAECLVNEKLAASSEKMSGLTPFCELYAIFSEGDLVFEEQGNRYTAIKDRLIPVRFGGVMGEPLLPDGIKKDSKIVK